MLPQFLMLLCGKYYFCNFYGMVNSSYEFGAHEEVPIHPFSKCKILRIDYCGVAPFCSTRTKLLLYISLLKVLICIIY